MSRATWGGLARHDTAHALAGFKYLTFKEDDDDDITLGKCPFCGGRVFSAVESGREGALVAYWCVRLSMRTVACWEGGDGCIFRLARRIRRRPEGSTCRGRPCRQVGRRLRTLMHPSPMPRCGGRPAFVAVNAVLCFGCPDDGLVKSEVHGPARAGRQVERRGVAPESAGSMPVGRAGGRMRDSEPRHGPIGSRASSSTLLLRLAAEQFGGQPFPRFRGRGR